MGEVREGQKVKLRFKMDDNSDKEFDCVIKRLYEDRLSLKFPPEILDYSKYLDEGQELSVRICTPAGVKIFDAMILNSPLEQDFVIEYVQDPLQIQRREFTRGELETKVIIQRADYDNISTHTFDISGGGLRFFYDGSFEHNEIVDIYLYLPMEAKTIHGQGMILDKEYLPKTEHILLFTTIQERDRDKIVKKCFDVQAAMYRQLDEANLEAE